MVGFADYDFDCYDDFDANKDSVLKVISNGEESVCIYKKDNGEVYSSDGHFFSNINHDDFEDALDEFECGWREVHWNHSDWADYYGCNENEVDDYMDDLYD